jgi:hypothetical protein
LSPKFSAGLPGAPVHRITTIQIGERLGNVYLRHHIVSRMNDAESWTILRQM